MAVDKYPVANPKMVPTARRFAPDKSALYEASQSGTHVPVHLQDIYYLTSFISGSLMDLCCRVWKVLRMISL